jgi:acetyl esterase/lipase
MKVLLRSCMHGRIATFVSTLFFLSLCFASCAGLDTAKSQTSLSLPAAHYRIVIENNIAYGPLPAEKINLCLPLATIGQRPAILFIHGGGWVAGHISDFDNMCRLLAEQGYVAATIGYRLAVMSQPSTHWPAQIVDAQLAVRWLRAHQAQLDINPDHLCAWGSSAGGHLSVELGTLKTIHPGDEAELYTNQSPTVSCVIDEFGPTDLTSHKTPLLTSDLLKLFGGITYEQNPEPYEDMSPVLHITMQNAPTLIIQGTQDIVVPPQQSLELQHALQTHHIPAQYISYNGEHSFIKLSSEQHNKIIDQEITFLGEY